MSWFLRSAGLCACLALPVFSQAVPQAAPQPAPQSTAQSTQDDVKARVKGVREYGKGGSENIPKIEPYLADPSLDVRLEAVKSIVNIGTQRSLDPLVKVTADNDPEVQIQATDGLVNFYLPGYVQGGFGASIRRVGTSIKGKFTDTNDQVVDPYITVRPDVVAAIGALIRGGNGLEARANAARAVGILRGKEAVPDLVAALRTKDTTVLYEALIALHSYSLGTADCCFVAGSWNAER